MKKWISLLVLAAALALGYVAAGPFIAIHRIRDAIERQDMPALARHVDFPAVRGSLRQQLEDHIARQAGPGVQSSALGAIALRVAGELTGGVADLLATPAGIGAVLQGRDVLRRIGGGGIPPTGADGQAPPQELLGDAEYRYESLSRFTATVRNRDGDPVVLVFTRDGLRWRVTDVRLPLQSLELADLIQAIRLER